MCIVQVFPNLEVFQRSARSHPDEILTADQFGGVRSPRSFPFIDGISSSPTLHSR